jgi:MoaA/NifB/PqqE/SkfB family radical SAM enzyme
MTMDDYFMLQDGVTVRREWFGCLCCNSRLGHYSQLNEDAYEILAQLEKPASLKALRARLAARSLDIDDEALRDFLGSLQSSNLVERTSDPARSVRAEVFPYGSEPLRLDCLAAPASVSIYVTDVCTKSCRHCVVRSSPASGRGGELDLAQWTKALGKLKAAGVCSVVFTGGEPLLREDIFDLLKTASGLRLNISLLTDYDGMSQAHIARLMSIPGLNYIQTSLDGATARTHDFLRGQGSFERTLRRLELFRANKVRYAISTVVSKLNINELEGIADIYRKYGAAYLYLNPLTPYGRAKKALEHIVLSEEEIAGLSRSYHALVSSGKVHSGNAFWQELKEEEAAAPGFNPLKDSLHAFSTGAYNMAIDARGECTLDSKMKSEGLVRLGNILKDDVLAMWHDRRIDPLRAAVVGKDFKFIDRELVSAYLQ